MKKHDFIEFMKFDNALVNKLLELYNIDDTNIKDFITIRTGNSILKLIELAKGENK